MREERGGKGRVEGTRGEGRGHREGRGNGGGGGSERHGKQRCPCVESFNRSSGHKVGVGSQGARCSDPSSSAVCLGRGSWVVNGVPACQQHAEMNAGTCSFPNSRTVYNVLVGVGALHTG